MAGQKRVFALDVPAIHVLFFLATAGKTWMPGTRPGMTVRMNTLRGYLSSPLAAATSTCRPAFATLAGRKLSRKPCTFSKAPRS